MWMRLATDFARQVGAWGRWSTMIIVLIPSILALAALWVMRFVRRRWLWRRTGYVKSSQWMVPRRVSLISAVILIVVLVAGALLQSRLPADEMFLLRLLFVASGWSFAYTLIEMGGLLDLARYIRVGLFAGLASTVLLVLPISVGQTGLLWGLLWGGSLSASGISALRETVRTIRYDG
jgi:hypothetical protein